MYGDTEVMRKRAAQLREQGSDIRMTADQLVAQVEGVAWTGRAADSMRERIRERAAQLRLAATGHDTAADSLERHLLEIDDLKEAVADKARRAAALVEDARARIARVDAHDDPEGVRRTPDPTDRALAAFDPPPPGHQDWLTVSLPGL